MTSGVRWNEDYTDLKSDVARMYAEPPAPGVDMTVSYVRKLPREAPPGTRWVYKTSETNLVGVLVMAATGKRWPNTCRKRSGGRTAWSAMPNGCSTTSGTSRADAVWR